MGDKMNPAKLTEIATNLAKVQSFDPWSAKWINEAHMALRDLASQPAEQPRGEPVAWRSPDELPDVKANDCRFFQIAVRRKSGKVFSYPAVYCNSLALTVEYEPKESSGNRWSSHFLSEELADEGELGFTGWWDVKSNCEYDTCYEPALEDDDELVAWCELPNWNADTAQPKPEQAVGDGVVQDAARYRWLNAHIEVTVNRGCPSCLSFELRTDADRDQPHSLLIDQAIDIEMGKDPRPAVATPAEVTDIVAELAHMALEGGCSMDAHDMSVRCSQLADRLAALTAQCQVRKDGQGVESALRELVEACEKEFCDRITERDEPDDSKVSTPEDRCHITFGHIRRARAALASPSAGEVVPDGWKPIETAPNDGTKHVRGLHVYSSTDGAFLYWDAVAGYVGEEDGIFYNTEGDVSGWDAQDYTHWFPLPVEPKADATSAGRMGVE